MAEYMTEMTCPGCGRTAHITWDGTGPDRRIVNISESLEEIPGKPHSFLCRDCDTAQLG
jgi:hypothetical protein